MGSYRQGQWIEVRPNLFHLYTYDSGEYVTDGDRVLRHVPVKISSKAKILK